MNLNQIEPIEPNEFLFNSMNENEIYGTLSNKNELNKINEINKINKLNKNKIKKIIKINESNENKINELNEKEINELENFCKLTFINDDNKIKIEYKKKYYDLFIYDKIFIPNETINQYNKECYYIGLYYEIKKNYELMEKYYIKANENGNPDAMYNLGWLYFYVKEDTKLMEKYFIMATEKGNINAMYTLGKYYEITININLMKKYYLMAISFGCINAMIKLGLYYNNIEGRKLLTKKYLNMAVNKGNIEAMEYMGNYYIKFEKNKYLSGHYYHLMSQEDPYELIDWGILEKANHKLFDIVINNILHIIYLEKHDIYYFYKLVKYVFRFLYMFYFQPNFNKKTFNNLMIFFTYLGRIKYGKQTDYRKKQKEVLKDIMEFFQLVIVIDDSENVVQIRCPKIRNITLKEIDIDEILKIKYNEYIENKFTPGCPGYLKTKKDFEERSNKQSEKEGKAGEKERSEEKNQ
jgi:hypothetical protein